MSASTIGRKHLAAAKAALKTGLFKWSPDWTLAASAYEKAAVSFKAAGEPVDCVAAYQEGAHAYLKQGSDFAAAKCWEMAAEVSLGLAKANKGSVTEAVAQAKQAATDYGQAFSLYRVGGEASKAASCMSNKARALAFAAESLPESHNERSELLNQSLEGFLDACEVLESGGKAAFSLDTFRHSLNFMVKLKQWKSALKIMDRMLPVLEQLRQTSAIHKTRLSKVIVNLQRNDITSARNAFREGFDDADYLRSDECAAAEDLINAWEAMDEEAVKQVVKRQVFQFLERQISLVAHFLSPYTASSDEPLMSTAPAASTTIVSSAPTPTSALAASQGQEQEEQLRSALFTSPQSENHTAVHSAPLEQNSEEQNSEKNESNESVEAKHKAEPTNSQASCEQDGNNPPHSLKNTTSCREDISEPSGSENQMTENFEENLKINEGTAVASSTESSVEQLPPNTVEPDDFDLDVLR